LKGFDQGLAGLFTLKTTKILGGDDDDFVAPVHGDMLWALAAHLAHQFAESGFGIL
jgi:hypothetical protein